MTDHIVIIAERIVRAAEDEIATEYLDSISVPSQGATGVPQPVYDWAWDWQDDYEASLAYAPLWRRVLERLRRLARRNFRYS